jgi:Ca2+-binding EF-hand superfamily protein
LGGVIDITKVQAETTIIFQCFAASLLVVAGNFIIANEEAEKEEEEKEAAKEEAERVKQRVVLLADLEAGKISAQECEVQLFGSTKVVKEEEYDIWRDSLLRYLGYSNELGEALRPVFPAAYAASYALAFSYVLADSVDKGGRADKRKRENLAKSLFISMDSGCEGYLTKSDVRSAFEKLKTPLPEADLEEYFAKTDVSVNGNSLINLEQFMALYEKEDENFMAIVDKFETPAPFSGPLNNPALVAGGDALIWQTIASVALPGFTINRFVALAEIGCEAQGQAGNVVAEYFPTILGLSMIPIICKPLDELADVGLDKTLRPLLFATIDQDKSGTVDYDDLAKSLKVRDGDISEPALRQLFDDMDTDKNGCITVDDWANGGYNKYKMFLERSQKNVEVRVPAGAL